MMQNPIGRGVIVLAVVMAFVSAEMTTVAEGAIKEKVSKELLDEITKQMSKSAAKKYIPVVNVFTTAYETTQLVMESANIIDASNNIAQGMTRNQPWGVAYTNVFGIGPCVDSDTGITSAHAHCSEGSWLGDAATSDANASINGPVMVVSGASKGWASWVGFAGIGLRMQIGADSLPKVIALELTNKALDPIGGYGTPLIDISNPNDIEREVSLLEPSGFDHMVRLYYPSEDPNTPGGLFYEAEVFGFLALVDDQATTWQDAVQPMIIAVADYYDANGQPIPNKHIEGTDVINFTASDFSYYEETRMLPSGQDLDVFGYKADNLTLEFNIDTPDEWATNKVNWYVHADVQAAIGGRSTRVIPEPSAFALTTISLFSVSFVAWSRRRQE